MTRTLSIPAGGWFQFSVPLTQSRDQALSGTSLIRKEPGTTLTESSRTRPAFTGTYFRWKLERAGGLTGRRPPGGAEPGRGLIWGGPAGFPLSPPTPIEGEYPGLADWCCNEPGMPEGTPGRWFAVA